MEATARLGGFFIEDNVQPNSKYIATSSLDGTKEDLIVISFRQCSQEHPKYPGELIRINASFNHFFLILNGDTIRTLIKFGMEDVLKELYVQKYYHNNYNREVMQGPPAKQNNAPKAVGMILKSI